jgi:hypothetical protein
MGIAFAQAPAAPTPTKTVPAAQEPPAGQDPVIGQWSNGGSPLILGADGTITGGRHGTWQYHGIVEGGRHYELHWNPPKNWSDWVNISADGNRLEGHSRGKSVSYVRQAENVAAAGTNANPLAGTAKVDVPPSPTEILAQQTPNAMEWALAPLNEKVPGDIRQSVTLLREDLLDEAAKKPTVSPAAYKLGEELCNGLINALNERDVARVRAGYTAAQAQANMGEITNQALEARRHKTSWPTYSRENAQREEVRKQKENGAALENQRPVIEWFDRGAQFRVGLNALKAQFREAARKPLAAH